MKFMGPQGGDVLRRAAEHIRAALSAVPFIDGQDPVSEEWLSSARADFSLEIRVSERPWTLVCEARSSGQPRFVREGAFQLRRRLQSLSTGRAYGVFLAPYLSEQSRALLREEALGYLDFDGNCLLSFDGVFIERQGAPHAPAGRRELRQIFAPQASRVLRVLFTDPGRAWRVAELAGQGAVSLGQVSNVRRALLDHEWARPASPGLRLSQPGRILDAWRAVYAGKLEARKPAYTVLHAEALDKAVRAALQAAGPGPHLLLGAHSAAQWLAPYAPGGRYVLLRGCGGGGRAA